MDIILYALIALGLVLWLRSLLGMREDGERQRPNPFLEKDKTATRQTGRPALLPGLKPKMLSPEGAADRLSGLGRTMAVADTAQSKLKAIASADRSFDLSHFLTGAQDAFIMIVEAFARGERATLRHLLADAVYHDFADALDGRERRGETGSVEIHAIRRAEVISAALQGRTASITVRFTADETNVVKAKDGVVVQGNPDRIFETVDIWTFTRDMNSPQPGWLITQTRDEDADPQSKPVPDSH
jgi:predicted lipid-binding transport protein (Tim44 family)